MSRAIRSSAASTATKITHRGRSPERAASLLVGQLGPTDALVLVSRELHSARKARSRLRFQFWALVRDTIDRQPYAAGFSEDRRCTSTRPNSQTAGDAPLSQRL
jgi:hypothetical protein